MGILRRVLKSVAKKALLAAAVYGTKRIADKIASRAAKTGAKGNTDGH